MLYECFQFSLEKTGNVLRTTLIERTFINDVKLLFDFN